jgi:choline dehydrogenase-like flavoprotein
LLIDARRLPVQTLQARVCIVGSGMGGASVAKKLIEAGIDVLFIEAGGEEPDRGASPVQHEAVGHSFGLARTRALEIGGSTNLWHGVCAPLDHIDFETRDWIADSGWPISREDLTPHYEEAVRWLGVTAAAVEDVEAAPAVREILTPKPFWTCRTPARMKGAVLGWAKAGRARCLTHAVALEFRGDGEGRVHSLVVGCGDRTIQIEAEVFISAAGGLETPRLLLNSHMGGPLAGRYLTDHPTGYFSQVVFGEAQSSLFGSPSLVGAGHFAGFAVRAELQRQYRLPNHYVFLRPGMNSARVPNELLRTFLGVRGVGGLSLGHVRTLLTSRYVRQRMVRERFGVRAMTRFGDIYIMAEQVPNALSRVLLSDTTRDRFGYRVAQVDWRLTANEWDHFGDYFGLVTEGLRRDDRVADVRSDAVEEWPQVLSSAAHHLGAARMAATPRRGVVDANLRVFGRRNLFVCDASVFSTSGGTNPSFTISALALRLGGLLARTLAAPVAADLAV